MGDTFAQVVAAVTHHGPIPRPHAQKAETQAARIEKFVAMLAKHEEVHP